MRGRTRTMVVSAVAMVTFLIAGAAFAFTPDPDTVFNYGYDPADQVLLIGMSGWDYAYECTLADQGTVTATYGFGEDGSILVDSLVDPSLNSVEFTDCNLIGMQLTDAATHGDFMNALHDLLGDMKGWGCVNSVIAKSDLGKGGSGDESDDDGATTTTTLVEETTTTTLAPDLGVDGTFDFTTDGVTCSHGKSQDQHGKSADHGSGQDHAAKGQDHPNHGQGHENNGKSDEDPGHNM